MTKGLIVDGARVSHGQVTAVFHASLAVPPGSLTAMLGPNAAGKSSLMAFVAGQAKGEAAAVTFDDEPLGRLSPRERIRLGVVLVPQGRLLFPRLTVSENLRVVADAMKLPATAMDHAVDRFPALTSRWSSRVGVLSGGEQQMLAIARGLMCSPRLLLLDEPTLGLAPIVVAELMSVVTTLCSEGVGVLIAEPVMANVPTNIDGGWVMLRGQTVARASSHEELTLAYTRSVGLDPTLAQSSEAGAK